MCEAGVAPAYTVSRASFSASNRPGHWIVKPVQRSVGPLDRREIETTANQLCFVSHAFGVAFALEACYDRDAAFFSRVFLTFLTQDLSQKNKNAAG